MIDLHTHTKFSDGTDTADEWTAAAIAAGATTIAITDHDTTAGWAAAAAARPADMNLVRGAELSTHVVRDGRRYSIHLLAYLFDPADAELSNELTRLRADRLERGLAITDRMVADGLPISREQVLDIADGAPVGRPHIGQALVAVGLARTVTEAFATHLAYRGRYYVSKADTALVDAIALVRGAGGVPVIAHPRSRGAAALTDEAMLCEWVDAGLAGIEVDHPDHGPADRIELAAIARRTGLITTGSSDYHGSNKSLVIGQETTAPEALAAIVDQSSGVTSLLGPGE